jgi:hypothetical protein
VEGGGGGLTVSGVSQNRGGSVKCVAIKKRLGIPALDSNSHLDFSLLLVYKKQMNDACQCFINFGV